MTELSDAMRRLTDTWTMRVSVGDGDRDQHFPPLVDMLRSRIVPDGNQTGGGSAVNTRNVLDVKSLDLLTHIQDVARAWLQEWRIVATGELKTDLRSYWGHLNTLHNTDAMDDVTFEHLAAYPDTWAVNIWDLIEPPIRVSVRGLPCPRCGVGKIVNTNGDQADNLMILWRDGQEPTAECQASECGAIWVGDQGLEGLGKEAGLEIDFQALWEARAARHA